MSNPSPYTTEAGRRLSEIEAVFSALAHTRRRQILLVLHYRGGSMKAGEIAARFRCKWPTVTRHLRVLERAGLVAVIAEGRERVYQLDRGRLRRVAGGWLQHFESEGAPSGQRE